LRAISRAIERFCAKRPRFGIRNFMRYVIFLTAFTYLLFMLDIGNRFSHYLLFNPEAILKRGQIWRLVTWIFIPETWNLLYLALFLYFYYFVGNALESEWGTAKLSFYYMLGIILNIIFGFLCWIALGVPVGITPGYLNMSLFFAFAVLFPDYELLVFFVIPVKVKWLALINAFYFLYGIYFRIYLKQYALALLPVVAILNFFIICGNDLQNRVRPVKARAQSATSRDAINFRRATRQNQTQNESDDGTGYRHKCTVCNKTDAEHPTLEFRYCSRCEGYHCYCIDHINRHEHIR